MLVRIAVLRGVLLGIFGPKRLILNGEGRALAVAWGDAKHDDASAIQSALDAPARGTRVVMPPGIFFAALPLTLSASVTLAGADSRSASASGFWSSGSTSPGGW